MNKEYGSVKNSLRNVTKDIAERVLNVLEYSGSEILRSEHLESGGYKIPLKSILIMSEQMKRSVRSFLEIIPKIGSSERMETGSQFYITDFGGSKTQFIELIKSIINENMLRDEPPFNKIIPVTFNGSIDLTAHFLGDQIENNTAKILTRQLEILQRDPSSKIDPHAFENFMNLLLEFRKIKNAPAHLDQIHNLLLDLDRISDNSPGVRIKISKIRNELSQLPLLDEERLLNIVFDIMEFASKFNILYLFFFDECDDWLAKIEEESRWDSNFLKRQYFFRKLYDRISNLRIYQIYCFTPRVHESLRSEKSDSAPGIQRISSDLIKISSNGPYIQIREQGSFRDEEAIEATLKWLVLLEKIYQPADKEIFNSFLPKLIEKIDNKLSRRKANSTIISSIRAFIKLTDDIKYGQSQFDLADRNPSYYLTIGNIIEKTFSSYLNFLNFNFEKKHQDVGGGKKIDGRFILGAIGDDNKLLAEIKSFKEPSTFNIEKAKQVIECVKDSNSKAVFFLFCRELTEDFVSEKFHEWRNFGFIPTEVNLDNIIPIIISDQTLLNCLVGFEQIQPSELGDKFENLDKLLRLSNRDFHGKLINLFPTKDIIQEPSDGKERDDGPPPPELETYSELLKKLKKINDTTHRTAIEVIISLGNKNKVYIYRKTETLKNSIKSPLFKNSFEDAIEYLKLHEIVQEIDEKLQLNWDIFDRSDIKSDPEGLMVEVFKKLNSLNLI